MSKEVDSAKLWPDSSQCSSFISTQSVQGYPQLGCLYRTMGEMWPTYKMANDWWEEWVYLIDLLWTASPGKDRVKIICQGDMYTPCTVSYSAVLVAGCYSCNSQFPTSKKKIENNDHLCKWKEGMDWADCQRTSEFFTLKELQAFANSEFWLCGSLLLWFSQKYLR